MAIDVILAKRVSVGCMARQYTAHAEADSLLAGAQVRRWQERSMP